MSVDQSDKIDIISIDPKGNVVLTISDHLPWDEEMGHLHILQTKLNSYLLFIESGQIYEDYPIAEGKPLIIDVMAKYLPNEPAKTFLKNVKNALEQAGYGFRLSFIPGS